MSNDDPRTSPSGGSTSSPLAIALAWLIVALPAGWGIYQTAITSMALFRAAPASQVSPAATSQPHVFTTAP